jgi:hypothetical protein
MKSGGLVLFETDWLKFVTDLNAFERSYTLEGTAGHHELTVIGTILSQMLPTKL